MLEQVSDEVTCPERVKNLIEPLVTITQHRRPNFPGGLGVKPDRVAY